jgi:hypothetical protein
MMLNNTLGCCTISAVGHAVQVLTANASQELTLPDSTILQYYEQWDGYNPANPATDQGGVELDVLNNWRQQGFAGQTLEAYVAIDIGTRDSGHGTRQSATAQPQDLVPALTQAIWLFGGAYIGVELPLTAQRQDVWDVADGPDADPGSWGGHSVYLVGYETPVTTPSLSAPPLLNQEGSFAGPSPVSRVPCPGSLTCITWGQLKKLTWAWFEKYCSEAYALISRDWIEATGVSPSGFVLSALEADLKLVTS